MGMNSMDLRVRIYIYIYMTCVNFVHIAQMRRCLLFQGRYGK